MSNNPLQHDFDDELLSAYLDGELSAEERAVVESRLAADPAARQMLDQLRNVSQSVHGLPQETVGRDLRESILWQAEEAKHTSKKDTSKGASAGLGDTMPKLTIGRTTRGWMWASLAVAAGLLIMILQPDPREDGNLPAVARRNNEAPAFTATPEAAPPSTSLSTARELADAEGAMASSAAGGAPIAANGRPVDQLGMATEGEADRSDVGALDNAPSPREPAEAVDEEELVVVHVRAKRAAIENKTFDQLLAKNGIVVDPAAPADDGVDASVDQLRERATTNRFAVPAVEQPTNAEAEVDVVLVEAPSTAIMQCMSDLNQDFANYVGVSVDESKPADEVSDLKAAVPIKKLAFDLGKYSRGVVPQQQKDSFARDKAYYYEPEARRFGGGVGGGVGGSLDATSGIKQEERESLTRESGVYQGRAQRVLNRGMESYRGGERPGRGEAVARGQAASEELKQRNLQQAAKSPALSAGDRLQVLFVLSPDDAPASPAAENRAE